MTTLTSPIPRFCGYLTVARFRRCLADTYGRLRSGSAVQPVMDWFLSHGADLRASPGERWRAFAETDFHHNPMRRLIHESPFSARSYAQPRRYAGNAVTLDYIYGLTQVTNISSFGRAMYDCEYETGACRSVRARRDVLASMIDETAGRRNGACILLAACGYLREAELSDALRSGGVR